MGAADDLAREVSEKLGGAMRDDGWTPTTLGDASRMEPAFIAQLIRRQCVPCVGSVAILAQTMGLDLRSLCLDEPMGPTTAGRAFAEELADAPDDVREHVMALLRIGGKGG